MGKSMTELRSVTCHMGSHSVTCHPTQVSAPRLNPSHAGRYSIHLPRRDGRLSWRTTGLACPSVRPSLCAVPSCSSTSEKVVENWKVRRTLSQQQSISCDLTYSTCSVWGRVCDARVGLFSHAADNSQLHRLKFTVSTRQCRHHAILTRKQKDIKIAVNVSQRRRMLGRFYR